jgi:hypothetical protein
LADLKPWGLDATHSYPDPTPSEMYCLPKGNRLSECDDREAGDSFELGCVRGRDGHAMT